MIMTIEQERDWYKQLAILEADTALQALATIEVLKSLPGVQNIEGVISTVNSLGAILHENALELRILAETGPKDNGILVNMSRDN